MLHATIFRCVLTFSDLPLWCSKAFSAVCTLKRTHLPQVGVCSLTAAFRNGGLVHLRGAAESHTMGSHGIDVYRVRLPKPGVAFTALIDFFVKAPGAVHGRLRDQTKDCCVAGASIFGMFAYT